MISQSVSNREFFAMGSRRVRTVFLLLTVASCAHAIIEDAIDVIKLGKEIGEEVLSSWDILSKPFNGSGGVDIPIIRRKERLVLSRLAQVNREIQKIQLSLEKNRAITSSLIRAIHRGPRLELMLHDISDLLSRVYIADRDMKEYVRSQQILERKTLEHFAELSVSKDSTALSGLLERIHSMIVPPHQNLLRQGLFEVILEDVELLALFALFAFTLAGDQTLVDKSRDRFYKLEEALWTNITRGKQDESSISFEDIDLTKALSEFANELENVPTPAPLTLKTWLWTKAAEKIQIVEKHYKGFVDFVKRQSVPGAVPAPIREWLDLDESIRIADSSVTHAVRKLDDLLEHGDLFRTALQEDHPDYCDLQMSQHQIIYDMYNTIALTEIKGYAMMQFSWMLLRIYNKGNYTQEATLTRQRYGERSAKTAAAARAALAMARRDVYRCEPTMYQKGVNYDEVTRLLQGYIENEVDMNEEGTCKENCGFYTMTKSHGCFQNMCNEPARCHGRIVDCQYIDSDMWICPAKAGSMRRYEFIEYENGRVLGQPKNCGQTPKVDSWWRFPVHCSYCMCLCEDDVNVSERFFSMREVVSNMAENNVVTGLRLIKVGRVFHLQISEGKLGERGNVTPKGWMSVKRFDPNDPGVSEDDYHTLTYEKRAIDLDELDSPQGHILTGVKFRMHGPHLHFEIRSTPFNYSTGRLMPEKSQWISNDNTDVADMPRTRLILTNPDIPTRMHQPQSIDSTHDQYVDFTNSDLDADAAQSTVPFVDIQPIQPLKGSALLSGAGIAHRGMKGSGGLITVKLFTYDYSKHVQADAPNENSFVDDGFETTENVLPMVNTY